MLLFEVPSHALRERLWKVLISTLIYSISSHTAVYCAAQGKLKHVSYSIVESYIKDRKVWILKYRSKTSLRLLPQQTWQYWLDIYNQTK